MSENVAKTKVCANCGEAFCRTRSPETGYVEAMSKFQDRVYCSRQCASVGGREKWTNEAMAGVEELLSAGFTFEECTMVLHHTKGHDVLTRHHIAGAVHRQRNRCPEEPPMLPAPIVPEPTRDKPESACRYGDCRWTRQPGREFCAEHHRWMVADMVPRVHARDETWRFS